MKNPMVHQTDLFHPHNDPDDHWDLACVYALALQGRFDLKAVLIDYPPEKMAGDPDVFAVNQLNHITGLSAPAIVGTPRSFEDATENCPDGVNSVINILRDSAGPVVINIVGSCKDIALAAIREPALFKNKCKAIYLNAGIGSPAMSAGDLQEYNVTLNAAAYSSLFDVQCPIYWMPCFENLRTQMILQNVMEYGTYYSFRQQEILQYLSTRLQKYFLYMLGKSEDSNWLRYLYGPPDRTSLDLFGPVERGMWCTGGFFHAAGLTVTCDGEILPAGEAACNEVFAFEPIDVACDSRGYTSWTPDASARDRFIFHVKDVEKYATAMTKAMKSLLANLI